MLPSERKFAVQLDVSRITVREAPNVLEHPGIVQHMRGKGVFVKIKGMLRAMEAAIQYKLDIDHASYDFESCAIQILAALLEFCFGMKSSFANGCSVICRLYI